MDRGPKLYQPICFVAEEDRPLDVISESWVRTDQNGKEFCVWPDIYDKDEDIRQAVEKHKSPDEYWGKYPIKRVGKPTGQYLPINSFKTVRK